MSTITMTYGGYNFNPVPSLNLSRVYHKTEDGRIVYCTTNIDLNGTLTPFPTGAGGISNVIDLKDALTTAFDEQGSDFLIKCDETTLFECNPRINTLSFPQSTNNWVSSINYTINLEKTDGLPTGEFSKIRNVDDIINDWSLEPIEDNRYNTWSPQGTVDSRPAAYKLSHNLSAKGLTAYSDTSTLSGSKQAWEYAKDFCTGNMGYPTSSTSVFGLPATNVATFNHSRVQSASEQAGKYGLTETWLVLHSGENGGVAGNALEDFTIDIKQPSNSDIVIATIQGSIQGLNSSVCTGINMIDGPISANYWDNASGYWSTVQGRLLPRVLTAYDFVLSPAPTRSLNATYVSKSIATNIHNGTISYAYEYTNKPTGCVTDSLVEDISFSYTYPTDVFASIDVLGRTSGPIIQLMNTRTPYSLSLAVDVVVPIVTGCAAVFASFVEDITNISPHSEIKTLISAVETQLDTSYTTLVKTDDRINWQPHIGKYTRNVSWLYNSCTDEGTSVAELD